MSNAKYFLILLSIVLTYSLGCKAVDAWAAAQRSKEARHLMETCAKEGWCEVKQK